MIVDTHFHLWDLASKNVFYSWLGANVDHPMLGRVESLKRSYLIGEYMEVAGSAGVGRGVHVQCADPLPDPVEETVWLDSVARKCGYPQAVVAYADLEDENVAEILERQAAIDLVKGIRDVDISKGFVPLDKRYRGLALLSTFGLHYELRLVAHRIDETDAALEMCRAFPDTIVVLVHAGLPLSRSRVYLEQWRAQLSRLAKRSNVICKISGLGMGAYLDPIPEAGKVALDIVKECIGLFGPDRVMLGSNWPIDTVAWSYSDMMAIYNAALNGTSESERYAVTEGTAGRVYGL